MVDDEDTVKASYAGDGAEGVEHELLIGFHIFRVDLDEKVEVTTGIVALCDLVNALYGIHELSDKRLGVLLEPNVTQYEDAITHLLRVDDCHVAFNVSQALQALLALEGGRGREVNARSKFLDGHARVLLKELQDAAVGIIECLRICHSRILSNNIL